ncbi:MAG: VWA domain-containing protein [Clostridia bacterium]|nr:VWA domain-containing protein [Clostridia bacterium]
MKNGKSWSNGKKTKEVVIVVLLLLVAVVIALLVACKRNVTNLPSVAKSMFNVNARETVSSPNEEGQAVESISMETEGYAERNGEPGSWHLDKRAEWTDVDKARITFDVDSVMKKDEGMYKDVLLVLDVSGSMYGNKLAKVQSDSVELVEYLLSDSNNNVGLIVYDDVADTITGFTNNKSELVSQINSMSANGCTNYNDPLKHVDKVMENYVKQEGRDVITLFLTDGYPNVDTPNQIATYQMLKSKYPYMAINGVQYEMGASMTQEIIDISDAQWTAGMETLSNVLFEAAVTPVIFETFKIDDVINNEYFIVGTIDDIEVTSGTVNLQEENENQKVEWILDNNITGFSAKMTIDVTLKEEYKKVTGYYPTNKRTEVTYKDETSNSKEKQTEETPVLRRQEYSVIYDPNTPQGATVTGVPDTESYYPFENVTKVQEEPSCEGWNFYCWEFVTNNVKSVNEDTFIMPTNDVIMRAIWGKPSISKSMSGTVAEMAPDVKYAVQIYGINQDQGASGSTVGLTFGPATGRDYNNSYVTHTYEANSSGTYDVVILTHTISANGSETTTTEYLKNSKGNKVTRTETEKQKYDINMHNMTWEQIADVKDKSVFRDCMLCGDTKSVELYLNDTIKSGNIYEQYGDGAGTLNSAISQYYRMWNPSKNSTAYPERNNSAVGTGVTLSSDEQKYGSNARNANGYKVSHIRATLIGSDVSNPKIGYAGDINLTSSTCLYSCIESDLQNVITPKKVKYVTGRSTSDYDATNTPLVDSIWLFSNREIYGTAKYSGIKTEGIGTSGVGYNKFGDTESKYYMSSYNDNTTDNRTVYNETGLASHWWLRSLILWTDHFTDYVINKGSVSDYCIAYYSEGLSFGFCIK